jgi:hypothetical protein
MNENLELVYLHRDGLAYVEECLRQGTGLCAEVLRLPLINGETFAPLPKGTTLNRAKSFDTGGLLTRRNVNWWLARHVQLLWQSEAIGTLVVQDIWAKSSDRVVVESGMDKFYCNENVYYFISGMNADFRSVQSIGRAVTSFLFVAFFSGINIQHDTLPSNHLVEEHFIVETARSTKEVFVGAYDQEGLVVWRG